MTRLTLTARADLSTFYEADAARYRATKKAVTDCVTREVFIDFYKDCPSIGFACGDRPIGGILFDGRQAHIAVLPEFHGRWALLLKPALKWLFGLKSEIVVEVERDNLACLRFLDRHQWCRVGASATHVLYKLTPLGGSRKTEYAFARRTWQRSAAGDGDDIRAGRQFT